MAQLDANQLQAGLRKLEAAKRKANARYARYQETMLRLYYKKAA